MMSVPPTLFEAGHYFLKTLYQTDEAAVGPSFFSSLYFCETSWNCGTLCGTSRGNEGLASYELEERTQRADRVSVASGKKGSH